MRWDRTVLRSAATRAAGAAALLLCWACGEAAEEAATPAPVDAVEAVTPAPVDSVVVVFTDDEAPFAVRRPVASPSPGLRAALEWLVRGPTAEERAAGVDSWFSEATAGTLTSVEVDAAGQAIVDFHGLRDLIPNASSSTGSTLLLMELDGTVFQVPEIRSVEYRLDGSCTAFWEWLQRPCQTVTRPGG